MGRARDNLNSTRSREEIDHDDAVRRETQELRLELLYACDAEKFRAVQERMAEIALDKKTPVKTAVQAGAAHQRSITNLVQQAPQFTVSAGISMTSARMLELVESEGDAHTTGCGDPSLPSPATIPLPNAGATEAGRAGVGDLRLDQPVVPVSTDPEDGPHSGVPSQDGTTPPPASLAQRNYLRCPRCGARTDDEPHACPVPES